MKVILVLTKYSNLHFQPGGHELSPQTTECLGESPGLVAMGGDSCSKCCGFEPQHSILDGHFYTYVFVVEIVMLFEKTKINEKEAGEKTECKWVASAKGVSFQVQVFKRGN